MPADDPSGRPDAVDYYAALLTDSLPSDALCLTAVRGVGVSDALVRFGGFAGSRRTSIGTAGEASVRSYPDELPIVVADDAGGWTYLVEDNGYHGSLTETLMSLSKGTVVVSAYWNVNRDSRLSYAEDGRLLAEFDFVLQEAPYGGAPDRIQPFLSGLTFDSAHRNTAEALAFVERVTGVRMTREWLRDAHPASVIATATTFEPPGMSAWLDRVAPSIATATNASRHALRAAANHAVTSVHAAAELDQAESGWAVTIDPEAVSARDRASYRDRLLASARDSYRRALEQRWDRPRPFAHITDPIARLQAEHIHGRQPRPSTEERSLLARAHAWGAARARLHDDPHQSLLWVLVNAHRVDRRQWPQLRDDVTRVLSHAGH